VGKLENAEDAEDAEIGMVFHPLLSVLRVLCV
jgi:hypothetical protein